MFVLYLIACCILLASFGLHWLRSISVKFQSVPNGSDETGDDGTADVQRAQDLAAWKDLYYKLQNLEDHPNVLSTARHALLSLLREGLLVEKYKSPQRSILEIRTWNEEALDDFLTAEAQDVFDQWELYTNRRAGGSRPELFKDREHARRWLRNYAPLNLVDGAWLSHIHKITTPFDVRPITRHAWQNLSEELGDGSLEKNHIFIYRDLLRSVGIELPPSWDVGFLRDTNGMDDAQIWKAAVAQLLISLFPNDFLPEILGFNLHFERLSTQTLKASKELPEFGISGQYYLLHISIDNGHSGHSAMATAVVKQYLSHIRNTRPHAVQETWSRVQAGYLLSQSLDAKESLQSLEKKVADVLSDKIQLSRQIHCASRVRIGKQSLADWLAAYQGHGDVRWRAAFLDALANAKPWIAKGDSSKSRLIRELSWSGKMFGAFTTSEMRLISTWIDSLAPEGTPADDARYWQMVGVQTDSTVAAGDIAADHPVNSGAPLPPMRLETPQSFMPQAPIEPEALQSESLLPLWFAHAGILENVMNSPYRTTERLTSHIVCVLHAEMGYQEDSSGIAGMDELSQDGQDLVSIGTQMMINQGLHEPTCLKNVIAGARPKAPKAHDCSYKLLHWSMRPIRNESFLLGLARAFLDLEVAVLSNSDLLTGKPKLALRKIVSRKQQAFENCLQELLADRIQYKSFIHGYLTGRDEIKKSFE